MRAAGQEGDEGIKTFASGFNKVVERERGGDGITVAGAGGSDGTNDGTTAAALEMRVADNSSTSNSSSRVGAMEVNKVRMMSLMSWTFKLNRFSRLNHQVPAVSNRRAPSPIVASRQGTHFDCCSDNNLDWVV